MAFLDKKDIHELYIESKSEGDVWREDYHDYERLADNDLLEDLDENLPEVNDGSLAASLFKLPKRVVSRKLKGTASAEDADEAWITELANMQWEKKIIPNANSQAKFHRKWKDVVRKGAIYGGQPVVNLFVERGNYTGSDFVVPQAQDVTLEAGKVSDEDSDFIFWDVYYSKKQVKDMIEQAKAETKNGDGYNKWYLKELQDILDGKLISDRDSRQDHNKIQDKGINRSGFHFYIAFQRGIDAPFHMFFPAKGDKSGKSRAACVREWTNPDPTGDIPVHYFYCYQDFVNPYGIGIVKLAGGTQNVLDYMRQSDILATQIGIRPPKKIKGDDSQVDEDSLVYAQDANWYVGNAEVERMEMSNSIYEQLPGRISMYKTSLNQMIPTGDTSIGSQESGDPNYSKTPAGVKFQAASLSIDDEDVKDNLYETYAAVAKSMINTHFANMQGTDLMKLSDEERDILRKAGLEFPVDEEGNPTNELEIIWDNARATFEFEIDPESDKTKDDEKRLDGLLKVTDFIKDPATQQLIATGQPLILGSKKLDPGELLAEVISLASDNDKIIQDVDPQELEEAQVEEDLLAEEAAAQEASMGEQPVEQVTDISPEQAAANVQAVMQQYGVDQQTAAFALEMERGGQYPPEDIQLFLQRQGGVANVA
jgi:hypothetical protein